VSNKESEELTIDISLSVADRFKQLVGRDHAFDEPTLLDSFCTDRSLVRGRRPMLVVRPGNTAQVQSIVRLARETGTPLVPISSGTPHFLGDTVPTKGGVIVDFSDMRRVIKLDGYNRLARIEPGVTFGQLMPALESIGQRLNTPLAPRANKSVVTSALEREVSIMPKYDFDFMDPLTTIEVVYGTGDDFRTGSAVGPGRPDDGLTADLVNPWGPGSIDYYRLVTAAQGTMGLVTWAVIRTEIKPSIRKLFFIPVSTIDAAWAPVDQLLRRRVLDECIILDNKTLATFLAPDTSDIPAMKAQLAPFTIIAGIAGYLRRPGERVAIYENYLKEICAACDLIPQQTLPGAPGFEVNAADVISQPWSKAPYWKLRRGENIHEIFFLCPLSRFPEYVTQMANLVAASPLPDLDYSVYVQPAVQGRAAQCSFILPFNSEENAAVDALFLTASRALMANGAFFSRPYGQWANMVYDRDEDGAAMLIKLKAIFDPDGILNPGKLCF
jgi:FAD/FMN-containing dehydrogenase